MICFRVFHQWRRAPRACGENRECIATLRDYHCATGPANPTWNPNGASRPDECAVGVCTIAVKKPTKIGEIRSIFEHFLSRTWTIIWCLTNTYHFGGLSLIGSHSPFPFSMRQRKGNLSVLHQQVIADKHGALEAHRVRVVLSNNTFEDPAHCDFDALMKWKSLDSWGESTETFVVTCLNMFIRFTFPFLSQHFAVTSLSGCMKTIRWNSENLSSILFLS